MRLTHRHVESLSRPCRNESFASSRRDFLHQSNSKRTKVFRMATPAADEEGMGPMERGRHRYAKANYAGALVAFTEVCISPS